MTEKKVGTANWYVSCFVLALTMLLAGAAAVRLPAQERLVKLTHKQLNDLIKNAKEPADHEKLAAYYRQEAARLKQEAQEHETAAKMYSGSGMTKSGVPNGAPHCDTWAKLDTEAAKEAEALASMHEEMAKAAEQK
jgi:hypothetical protein